jgi:hypothetical protein
VTVVHLPHMARGWQPERAGCDRCGAPLALDAHPYEDEAPGVRAYTCGLCQNTTRFYSAAWLEPGAPTRAR